MRKYIEGFAGAAISLVGVAILLIAAPIVAARRWLRG